MLLYESEKEKRKEKIFDKCNNLLNFKNKLFYRKENYENELKYLLGFAIDVLTLMIKDQKNLILSDIFDDIYYTNIPDITNIPDYFFEEIDKRNNITNELFTNYGVKNLDELLIKYDKIRNFYYQIYKKLKVYDQEKYKIRNLKFSTQKYSCFYDSSLYINKEEYDFKNYKWFKEIQKVDFMLNVMLSENFEFAPTVEEMKNMINKRIIASHIYPFFSPFDYSCSKDEVFIFIKNKCINLTKNMEIKDVLNFYNNSIRYIFTHISPNLSDIYQNEDIKSYYDNIQKIFTEIILEKKKIKDKNKKIYEEEIVKELKKIQNNIEDDLQKLKNELEEEKNNNNSRR